MRIRRIRQGLIFYVGPWESRIAWGSGWFGWREGDGPLIHFIRRWWSGWHRWDDES